MWDDTTPRAQQIGAWLDSPMDLDEFYGKRAYLGCAMVLALWLAFYPLPPGATDRASRGGRDVA